jgi:hypothetical protein
MLWDLRSWSLSGKIIDFGLEYCLRLSFEVFVDRVTPNLHIGGYRWRMVRGLPMGL